MTSDEDPGRAATWLEADAVAWELNRALRRVGMGTRSGTWARPWIGGSGRGWVRVPLDTVREVTALLDSMTPPEE